MDITDNDVQITNTADRPPIVTHFSIEGLFGYRTISLDSKHAATVLIAKNGSGKTTFLGVLDAFLRGQFTRLAGLDFKRITCSLSVIPDLMEISKQDVERYLEICSDVEFIGAAKAWEVEPSALLELLVSSDLEEEPNRRGVLLDNPVFYAVYTKTRYEYQDALIVCKRLAEKITGRSERIDYVRRKVRHALDGFEIVYLPTYRRIELSIPDAKSRSTTRPKSLLSRLGVSLRGLHTGDIHFGLGDISDRLRTLYEQIQLEANRGYGKVSANIVNDLVSGAFEHSNPGFENRPSKDELEIFFARIKDTETEFRFVGPFRGLQIPDIEKIYSDEVPADSRKFLNYFLGQLNSVIQKTQNIESTVDQFISNCNRYLSCDDSSTHYSNSSFEPLNDDKELTVNRNRLLATVISRRTGKKIPLDALSSGEKQMISLFARLYLYPKKKIVLIDEPELSLSLEWQRKILPDILSAHTCEQIIAITHSPFIFDNALEPFAASLKLSFEVGARTDLSGNSGDDVDFDGVNGDE